MTWVLIIGLIMLAVALPIVARRVLFLFRLIRSGQPAPDRVANVTGRLGAAARNQVVEVLGQRRLLKWTIPGTAHAMVFWAFLILGTVYLEAFGVLFTRNPEWSIPLVGHWDLLGFAQDTIALLCLVGLLLFWQIRLKNAPDKLGRQSRFKGSHLGGAYLVLFMIFNVIWTMFFFRGSAAALDNLPYGWGAYGSRAVGALFSGIGHDALEVMEGVGLLLHIGIMLVFLIEVVHSKHLHIFLAPVNVLFKRESDGVALGAVKPLMNAGKPVTLDDIDDLDEDATLGVGSIEDFSWKGLLDFSTCTECGRCQDQCPAWNTEKPLSPKLMIMALRDHAMAKGPLILADGDEKKAALMEGNDTLTREGQRPLVGDTGDDWFYMPEDGSGVIDPDVLWSCVTCGACVNQCPVDIEHVDHIIDMRRYQVLVESNFPAELNQLFKGMENKGNPWNMSPNARMDWAKDLDFDVKVVGETIESLDEVEWLFWVGCAGAYEDRAKKTTRAVAELLDIAGVSFGVLGNGETCTGDSARRAGNEFVFQGLAQQNVETFKEFKVKKVVSTCAHCFNTLKNEYKEFGVELEVVHHTQLLNRLVREGKLTPVGEGPGAQKRSITYHDPCYVGRHNGVYSPPRELLQVLPGAELVEMPRNSEKSFCCGAGGARMWMEETIGSRINENRTAEAVGTGADQIAVGCPFCRVMLSDGLTSQQAKGEAREEVEVLDVAQMLLASVKGEVATRTKVGASAKARTADKPAEQAAPAAAEPAEAKEAPQEEAKPAEKSGGSLFDMGGDDETPAAPAKTEPKPADDSAKDTQPAAKAEDGLGGGSLFDLGADEPAAPAAKAEPKADEPEAEDKAEEATEEPASEPTPAAEPAAEIPSSGSLFDLEAPEPAAPAAQAEPKAEEPVEEKAPEPEAEAPEPEPEAKADEPAAAPSDEIPEGGSLFDIEAPEPAAPAAQAEPKAEEPVEEKAPEPGPEATEPEPEAQVEEPTEEPAEEPDSGLSAGAALSQAATFAATDEDTDAEPAAAAEPEPEAGPTEDDAAPNDEPEAQAEEPDEKPAEKPKPASSGEAHQPKTDADIDEAGSLFDL